MLQDDFEQTFQELNVLDDDQYLMDLQQIDLASFGLAAVSASTRSSLIVSIAFFAGMQLISLGVLGEYIARIFDEVKGRPLYLIAERTAEDAPKSHDQGASA